MECTRSGSVCGGKVIYRVAYRPDLSAIAGNWFCENCAKMMKDGGMVVIDKPHGLQKPEFPKA